MNDLKETKKNIKLFWKFIKNKKKTLVALICLTTILSLISVLLPILTAKLLVNLSGGILNELMKAAIFIFVVEIVRNITNYIYSRINSFYIEKTMIEIQLEMLSEYLKIETSEIDRNSSGIFTERIRDDVSGILRIYSRIFDYFVDFLSNFGVLIAVFIINKWMFIYFVFTSLIIFIIDSKRRNLYYKNNNSYRNSREKRTGLINEIIRGVRDIKLLNASNEILEKTDYELNKVKNEKINLDKVERRFDLITGSLRDALDVVFFALGSLFVYYNSITISSFVILYTYKDNVEAVFSLLSRMLDELKEFNLNATRINEILEDKFKKEKDEGIKINKINSIEFKNVSFSYDVDNVLNNVSFKINKGERIGFVGESGSGKSTIFNLISRLYKCENGEILINDTNINNICISSLRNEISLVSQSPYIFNFSIKDNIKLSNNNASFNEIVECTKKADIYDRIMEFENGFDTYIGEGGIILSGGERQRIAIARTLLKDSSIILFDESTSSLDNISQSKVQKSIYEINKDKIILIIAHRLSTLNNCDKIVVVDNGKILDIGTHKELLSRCNKYKELYKYETNK